MTPPDPLTALMARALVEQVPLSVQFELTNRCNETCAHCYVDLSDHDDELTTAEVLRILDELKGAGTLFLTFTGGEIFTRADVLVLARRARELGFALRLFSNGTLVDEDCAREIARCGVLAVELSVYSMDDAAHDAVTRVPGSLRRTLRGARLLRAHGVPVCLKSPILRGLAREHERIVAFAEEIGAATRFDPTVVASNDGNLRVLARRLTADEFGELAREPSLGLAIDPADASPPHPGDANCSAGRRVALISSKGLLFPCSQRFPPAGSLRHQSFRDIWETSPLLLRLRAMTAQDLPTCSSCGSASFCGRCGLDAHDEAGDFWGAPPWSCTMASARLAAFGEGGATARQNVAERFGERRPACEL